MRPTSARRWLLLSQTADSQGQKLRAVRAEAPDALIRVDANEAWTVESTVELIPALQELGVELVEQPLPAPNRDGYAELHALDLPIPIVLDESIHTLPDVAAELEVVTQARFAEILCAPSGPKLLSSVAPNVPVVPFCLCMVDTSPSRGSATACAVSVLS